MGECVFPTAKTYDKYDHEDWDGRDSNLLHKAVYCDNAKALKKMINLYSKKGTLSASLLHKNYSNQTPLEYAIELGYNQVINILARITPTYSAAAAGRTRTRTRTRKTRKLK